MKIGSLCSGYGGLDLAVEQVFGAEVAWFSEYEAAPSKILAHHWPNVPNLGDMTKIDWSSVEPVDIIAGGTPCQDLSGAGKRAGMTEGTRSNLWVQMREAIATIRPDYVVWENVRGAYSARADSEVEREQRLLGEPNVGPFLRALNRVLGDLSSLGYDSRWVGLRAADAGAPHNRFRVFLLAHTNRGRHEQRHANIGPVPITDSYSDDRTAAHPDRDGHGRTEVGQRVGRVDGADEVRAREWERARTIAISGSAPTVPNTDNPGFREQRGSVAVRTEQSPVERTSDDATWGSYAEAVAVWESIVGPAPAATVPDPASDGRRLSAEFVEWMMGLARGHVTSPELGLTLREQLKALGNGVVPQQAELALRTLLS